jgi:hypothetical protein
MGLFGKSECDELWRRLLCGSPGLDLLQGHWGTQRSAVQCQLLIEVKRLAARLNLGRHQRPAAHHAHVIPVVQWRPRGGVAY